MHFFKRLPIHHSLLFLLVFFSIGIVLPGVAHATDYTSKTANCATTCNWNDGANWDGGSGSDYPDDSVDTATISAGDYVVIPVGVSITTGAITFGNGSGAGNESTIDILGTLDLAGAVSMVNYAMIKGGPDGTLDLNGQTITVSGSVSRYNFTGTSGHPFNIISTGSRGVMTTSGAIQLVSTWDYVNISGLGDSIFGRSHTSAHTQHYEHVVFSDMEDFYIDGTSTGVNAGFEFNFNDIRNPHTPTGTDYQPRLIMGNQALGTAPREMTFNTWDGGSLLGKIFCSSCIGTVTFNNNVLKNFQIAAGGDNYITTQRNMFFNDLGSDQAFFLNSGMFNQAVTDHYFYYDGGAHPLGFIAGANDVRESVFENTGLSTDWFLYTTNSDTLTIKNNIFLGKGSPVTFTNAAAPTLDISNNTMYGTNDNTAFSWGVLSEQVAELTGTVNYYNNLLVDSNTTAGGESATYIRTDTADQVDLADYNGHAGYTDLGAYAPTLFSYLDNAGASIISPAPGANDIQADPLFVDKTRKLSTWDTSLGGAGTEANAITEMLKLNGYGGTYDSNYNVSDLVTYVFGGFTPQAAEFDGTGSGGADIGAVNFTSDVTAPTVSNVSSDKTNGTYTIGEVIDIDVTFSEAVTSTGNVTVTLETGDTDQTCTFSISNSTTGTCNYTVQASDASTDLTVSTISGTIADQIGNAMANFVPATNLAANKALVIDTTAPTLSSASPSGELSAGTTNTTLSVTTDENAACKYGTVAGTAFASIANTFSTTGTSTPTTSHSTTISGLSNGNSYTYYVRCADFVGNATSTDLTVSFSIANPTSSRAGQFAPSAQIVATTAEKQAAIAQIRAALIPLIQQLIVLLQQQIETMQASGNY